MSEKVRNLANLVERQLSAVTQSLSTLEDKGLDKLIRRDKKVDKLESEIIEQGVQVIALRAAGEDYAAFWSSRKLRPSLKEWVIMLGILRTGQR